MPTGLILQPTYTVRDDRPVVQLFGRLVDGPAFLIEDDCFRPYFFVRARDVAALGAVPGMSVDVRDLRDLEGTPVARVVLPLPSAAAALRDRLGRAGVTTYEADIRFPYRYLIDHGVRALASIDGTAEERDGLLLYRNPKLEPASGRPSLRVLSLDIETTPDASRLLSFAIAGCGAEEVHLVGKAAVAGAVVHADERTLLKAFVARVRALDPDVLLGWNVVDFDLRVIARRLAALRVGDGIGRVPGRIGFEQDRTFTRQGRAEVPGRMVLDGGGLVRDALRLEDYRLETVARAVLGRGKLLAADHPDPAAEINRLYRDDPAALAAYNLEDARLPLAIVEHEGLLELTLERSLLSGMQLDRVGASIASFDQIYLPELRRRGIVAPNVQADRPFVAVQGGAVLDSVPGLFRNVAVFDFKSLYPSLIRTFNLDPLAHARAPHDGADAIVAPNDARFSRRDAILPALLDGFLARREDAKQRGDRHADQAIKIMMNALFGVLGATACRFFDPAIANAITTFGQQTLRWTRAAFEDEGRAVLYGDTDSVFVELPQGVSGGDARALAEALRARVETYIKQRVRADYGVEPKLTLELEHVLERFFMPRVRSGAGGSKKRYAGWVDGKLLVVGLESVRRDWPVVARRLQEGMLEHVFTDRDPMPFVRDVVARLRAGDLDHELVYAKRIRKGSVERYTGAVPPHVQAARKAGSAAGPVIRYVITRSGPEPVLPGHPLPRDVDREHALERILRPVADAILPELGQSFDEALGRLRQLEMF
ncbi:DNA polymerase II [Candidatus Binatia bacterium]|nr:DNA polymerase II [Candidatus Binatia bacterium]